MEVIVSREGGSFGSSVVNFVTAFGQEGSDFNINTRVKNNHMIDHMTYCLLDVNV